MLSELFIRNFAIIDEIRLEFVGGFNVLTGETGAGKSIILDAVMLILGGRADKSMIRAGCKSASIEATFAIDANGQAAINPILENEGLESDDASVVTVAREVRESGRSICRLNGRAVNVSLLQQVGDYLVDIHGQGSHLSLLQPKSHLPLLDSFASLNAERRTLAEQVVALRKLQQELKSLQQDEQTMAQRVDLLKYQVEEIDNAALQPDEEDELKGERQRLANAENLKKFSAESLALLVGVDDDAISVVELLNKTERALTQLVRLDESKNEMLEQLQGLLFQINEVAGEVDVYHGSLEYNGERLDEVEERLELIRQLKRKYGDSIALILAHRDSSFDELSRFEHSGERAEWLTAEIDKQLHTIGAAALALSEKRQAAASKLGQMVEDELGHLKMEAQFSVDFEYVADEAGAYVGDQRLAFDQNGIDSAEFLISTNPGEPLKPMAKVASGGETARLMLALKTALAQVDATPTLIFDEIDQGIGGRIGDTVGRKLWGLTAIGGHQVIVVTHLPQLAGYGDRHYHVSKRVDEGRTRTHLSELTGEKRVAELADMIGTDTTHARGGASAILDNAKAVKTAHAA